MDLTWLVIGVAVFIIGVAFLAPCVIKEHQGKKLDYKFVLALTFLFVGTVIMAISLHGAKNLGPPERQPYEETKKEIKSVLFIPPQLGGIFIS